MTNWWPSDSWLGKLQKTLAISVTRLKAFAETIFSSLNDDFSLLDFQIFLESKQLKWVKSADKHFDWAECWPYIKITFGKKYFQGVFV